MEMSLIPISLFLVVFGILGGSANPVYPLVTKEVVIGAPQQNLVSTVPGVLGSQVLTSSPSLQSSIIQLLRQPGLVGNLNGGFTQLVVPGQQTVLNGAGVVPLVSSGFSGVVNPSGVTTLNGLGLTSGLTGLTLANVNGVPVLLSSSGLGLSNGIQTPAVTSVLPQQVGAASYVHPYLTQPVVREVAEVQEVETPASLVQLDPMDAALLDMENKGQIHMEKYAWGRSALNNKIKSSQQPTNTAAAFENSGSVEGLRSDLPRFYSQLPTGSIVSSQPAEIVGQNRPGAQSQLRNPFVDANGKRKKHFEFYQYFRNLNLNQPQTVIPVAVLPTENIYSE